MHRSTILFAIQAPKIYATLCSLLTMSHMTLFSYLLQMRLLKHSYQQYRCIHKVKFSSTLLCHYSSGHSHTSVHLHKCHFWWQTFMWLYYYQVYLNDWCIRTNTPLWAAWLLFSQQHHYQHHHHHHNHYHRSQQQHNLMRIFLLIHFRQRIVPCTYVCIYASVCTAICYIWMRSLYLYLSLVPWMNILMIENA